MNNPLKDVVYEYRCNNCGEHIEMPNSNFHKTNKCITCGGSYSSPVMYFNEKLTRPIQPNERR